MFNFKAKNLLSKDIGMDLGTTSVLVYVDGSGIVINEPSVVAVDKNTDCITKIGKDAHVMIGRNPGNIEIVKPLRAGVINRYDVTEKMIQYFIRRAGGSSVIRPRLVICIPTGISEIEERAVMDAGTNAGARKTYLVAEPVAAAVGAGVDIYSPTGNMIVDIGGGTTDVAVISMGGIVVSKSVKIAGDKFDEAIMEYVRREHNIAIGEGMAEQIKLRIGAVYEHKEAKTMSVKGRCLIQGLPKEVVLSSKKMLEAMMDPISAIFDTVCSVIEETPPELVGDILKNGIILTGGGSQLYGLDKLMTDVIGIRTRVAKDPVMCVALGTGKILQIIDNPPEGVIDLSRIKKKK